MKFKLTEFGTLEIISTVETEKGEMTWSTPTEHRKSTSDESNDAAKEGAAATKKDKGTCPIKCVGLENINTSPMKGFLV